MRTLSSASKRASERVPDRAHYRPDLDGLRAVAISMVVLYHLGSPFVPGGFIGVDVFFVISGYLITQNIRRQDHRGEWSFFRFYERRIRRLFPALLITVAFTWAFAALLFGPELFAQTSASAIAGLLSVSNINFWMSSGYFDTSQTLKPLLHTWSLSIEEQFYLIWPLLILTLVRQLQPRIQVGTLLLISLSSLAVAETLIDHDPDAAFYLMPARIFEFCIGALCVWIADRGAPSRRLAEALVSAGLVLILYSALSLNEGHRFPGLNALVPCLGTAFCIVGGTRARSAGSLLRNPLAVRLGLISYSLYLVHWPLIVFYSYWTLTPLTSLDRVLLSALSLIAALALFHGIEQRFRYASAPPQKPREGVPASSTIRFPLSFPLWSRLRPRFLIGCAGLTLLLCVPATLAWYSGGWGQRIGSPPTKTVQEVKPRAMPGELGGFVGALKPGQAEILLIGDSHAGHLATGLDAIGKAEHWKVQVYSSASCQPILGATKIFPARYAEKQKSCEQYLSHLDGLLASRRYAVVALAGRWEALLSPEKFLGRVTTPHYVIDAKGQETSLQNSREVFNRRLEQAVGRLVAQGSRVVLFGQAPSYASNPSDCLRVPRYLFSRAQLEKRCQIPEYDVLMSRLRFANQRFDALAAAHSGAVESILLSEVLCDSEKASCHVLEEGVPLYRDENHLSPAGSLLVAKRTAALFRSLLSDEESLANAKTAMHP